MNSFVEIRVVTAERRATIENFGRHSQEQPQPNKIVWSPDPPPPPTQEIHG
jgi:hypothetical protein